MSTTYEEIQEKNGDVYHFKIEKGVNTYRKVLHREGDMPAVSKKQGAQQEFWVDGVLIKSIIDGVKRTYRGGRVHSYGDEPAIVFEDGSSTWCKDGRIHREGDQPAVIRADGYKSWYENGVLCRKGKLPHVISGDGTQYWYNKKGELHRDGGLPAIICTNGKRRWYKNGIRLSLWNEILARFC